MCNIKVYKIRPKINFYEAEYYLKNQSLNPRIIGNLEVYNLVKDLTNKVYVSSKDQYEKQWKDFYLPLKRSGREISIPFSVVKYKKDFFCYFFRLGSLHIKKGKKETEEVYKKIFQEALRFIQLTKKTKGDVVKRTVPYDFRTGKIKGKYILSKIIPQKEKVEISEDYNHHLKKDLKTEGCSLNEYLGIASLCYKVAFGKKAAELKPLEMYKKWADTRDGGMLAINNWDSRSAFLNWHRSEKWTGSYPFEIVFSWRRHGIYLYPPSSYNSWRYFLRVTNCAYVVDFIKMVNVLIKNKIPFITQNLEEILDCLAGESYFTVNDYSDNFFFYIPSQEYKRKYFKHIEWEKLKILRRKDWIGG